MDRLYPDLHDTLTAAALFALILAVFAALSSATGYPRGNEWQFATIVALCVAAVPLVFRVLGFLQHTRSSVDIKGIKIDFGKTLTVPAVQLAENVVERNQPVTDSGTQAVVAVARQAHQSSVVVVDLQGGDAWYKTRLFALAAPALEFGYPRVIVFLATLNGTPCSFLGFADATAVAKAIMRDPQYQFAFRAALDKYHQLSALANPALRPLNLALQPDVDREAFDFEGRPSFMAILIHQMITVGLEPPGPVQPPTGQPPWINALELQQLLGGDLHFDKIEDRKKDPEAISHFFSSKADYIAVVRDRQFVGLVPAVRVLREVLGTLTAGE
jgi:hypothetical protein